MPKQNGNRNLQSLNETNSTVMTTSAEQDSSKEDSPLSHSPNKEVLPLPPHVALTSSHHNLLLSQYPLHSTRILTLLTS